jgi:DNA modification methylase
MELPLNQILHGDSLSLLPQFPAESVDVVFADPPYNLQLKTNLWRPNQTLVDAVNDAWDKFDNFADYDAFTAAWLSEVRRLMKPRSSIWISGTYHNIHRVGTMLQNLGFWLLNTVAWQKQNAMPNFNGTRLKNDVEYVIWAKKSERSRYTFNYQLLKHLNGGKQSGSVWKIPACGGAERLRFENGDKLHSTQKPEELLRRILLASTRPGDMVLDPFSGSGTTAKVAKELHLNWTGIERDEMYILPSRERVDNAVPLPPDNALMQDFLRTKPPGVAFRVLLERGYLQPGQPLYLEKSDCVAEILPDGSLLVNGATGSIHGLARELKQTHSANGWHQWRYDDPATGERLLIDTLRERYRADLLSAE